MFRSAVVLLLLGSALTGCSATTPTPTPQPAACAPASTDVTWSQPVVGDLEIAGVQRIVRGDGFESLEPIQRDGGTMVVDGNVSELPGFEGADKQAWIDELVTSAEDALELPSNFARSAEVTLEPFAVLQVEGDSSYIMARSIERTTIEFTLDCGGREVSGTLSALGGDSYITTFTCGSTVQESDVELAEYCDMIID